MINAEDMQSWAYLLSPTFQFVNTAGKPLTEGWIEVYISGTRNKYYCASDFNGILHPFQIPLDSLGANIVLADPNQAYDVYVYNKYGSLIMSRYNVNPGMAGGGVLNITITSEDGTVTVNNDGNGNFDLSIKDTVDRIETLEQAVSGLSSNSSVGYAIAHADTVNLDGTFNLVNDAITGIDYSTNMDGFRLKPGHVYQFNFNALFENGEYDRNCGGKLYLEGPNTIAQEWKFDLDDSYYHSQSINGSTVLVTPNDLNYYDVKLKLAWDVDYPNKPNVDLNKISIVDITTILSTTGSGTGGSYTGGDGIFINDETNVISVDMDYINSHLDFDASTIIASAVNIATAYTDARVTSVSGDLVNLIASVTGNIPTGSVTQVQSDWTEQDSSSPAYIKHKPDLTVYATNDSLTAVSSVLQSEVDAVSSSIPELPEEEAVEFEEIDLSDYALASAIPDVSDYVTHSEVSAVSGNIINTISTVSGDIIETVNNVSGDIIHTVESVSGDLVEIIETATANIPEQVNADWNAVSGKAEILNKPDLSVFATHNEVSGVSAVLNERINNVSADIPELPDEEEVEFEEIDLSDYALASAIPDVSNLVTHDEFVSAVTAVSSMIPNDYVTHSEVSAVSSNLVNYVNSVSGDITNYVDDSIVSAINVATGACEQVQSDWTEDDTTDPSYIKNKPNEIEIIAGQNIGIFSDATTITIAASATDLSGYATHSEVNAVSASIVNQIPDTSNLATRTEVNNVSGILETEIQTVSAAIGEQVPNVSIQSPSGTLTITETVSGNNKIYSIDVASTSGIEYGQFYATSVSGTAVMSKSKGNIEVTNDGKIKLKQGQSYHVTVRGRYNQVVLKDNYSTAAYIEYITNNFINVNVDESRSDNQYFELSYDLFKLNSDTNYLVFFNLDDAEVNDLYIEIHSLANVGGNGSSGGSTQEYDAGYGIQILNNVISVSGIAPQIQSDWNQTNTSSKDFIKNKPEEANLIAGAGVSITASGSNYVISAVVTGSPVVSGYVTEAELQTVSGNIVNQIPDVSNLATKQEVATVSAQIPDISGLATKVEVSTASGTLNTKIDNVSASIPTLPSEEEVEFEELDLSDYALASAIPDVSNLASKSEVNAVSGTLQTEIVAISGTMVDVPSGVSGVVAGQGIAITASGSDYVISCTVTGGGSTYTAGTGIDITNNEISVDNTVALKTDIPSVTGFATVELVSAVSGKLPTTETGKFTIKNNVSGGPIEVICPTDVGMPVMNTILDSNAISGIVGSGTSKYIVYKSPGYDNDYWNYSNSQISLTVPEDVTGIYNIYAYYSNNSNPLSSNAPYFINNYVVPDTQYYKLAAGNYTINTQTNGASSGYGKYITVVLAGPNPDATAFAKATIKGIERHPELGISVDLDRYYLGNTNTTTNNSGTQAVVYTDPTTKKQSVYLPNSMPSNWTPNSNIIQSFQYGNGYINPSIGWINYSQYRAYKYTSSPTRYQFAYCTDLDIPNKVMTFMAYDNSGNAIEKWTVDYTTYGSAVWTTAPISSDTSDYIPYSASGVYLPNSKFEIDTEGQAYKVIRAGGSGTETTTYNTDSQYIDYGQLVVVGNEFNVHIGDTISVNNLDSSCTSLKFLFIAGSVQWEVNNVAVTNNAATITADRDYVYTECVLTLYPETEVPSTNSETLTITHTDDTPAIKDEYITETSLASAIADVVIPVSGASGIAVNDNIISLDNPIGLVAGTNVSIEVTGSSAIISAVGGGTSDVNMADLVSVSGTLEAQVQTVSASIPTLPTEEEIDFEEVDLSDYALASAIPDVSGFATEVELQTVSAAIPDTSTLATKTEVTTGLGTKQDTLTGITDVQVVQSLPVSPVSSVLYLIPEA